MDMNYLAIRQQKKRLEGVERNNNPRQHYRTDGNVMFSFLRLDHQQGSDDDSDYSDSSAEEEMDTYSMFQDNAE